MAGPVPKHSLAPLTGPDAIYSGLLECPLTTRVQKLPDPGSEGFNDTYSANVFTACASSGAAPHASPKGPFCVTQNLNGISGDVSTPGISTSALKYYGKVQSGDACEAASDDSPPLHIHFCCFFFWFCFGSLKGVGNRGH